MADINWDLKFGTTSKRLAAQNESWDVMHLAKKGTLYVRQNEICVLDRSTINENNVENITTSGAPVCVCVSVWTDDKVALAHLDEESVENVDVIFNKLLEIPGDKKIAVSSGSGFNGNGNLGKTVLDYLDTLNENEHDITSIKAGKHNSLLVNAENGKSYWYNSDFKEGKYINPKDVTGNAVDQFAEFERDTPDWAEIKTVETWLQGDDNNENEEEAAAVQPVEPPHDVPVIAAEDPSGGDEEEESPSLASEVGGSGSGGAESSDPSIIENPSTGVESPEIGSMTEAEGGF